MTAIIDKGKRVTHVGNIEAYMINHARGTVYLYTSPECKKTVDILKHKLTFKDGARVIAVFKDGVIMS